MKAFIPALLLFFYAQISFAWDSVGVFHRSTKVIVLINEEGPGSRLQHFMRQLTIAKSIYHEDLRLGLMLNCARDAEKADCTFRFTPGKTVEIGPRYVVGQIPIDHIEPMSAAEEGFEVRFLNSNGDHFRMWIKDSILHFEGGKKI